MKEKNKRLPIENELGLLPAHPAVKTPWNKLISFHDAQHYACRHMAGVAATFMQVLRIIMPDYKERTKALIDINSARLRNTFLYPGVREHFRDRQNVPPFVQGTMISALAGDQGDEALLMTGRVNDFGTYRFEKELDTCPWDIVGSDFCRTTVAYFQALGNTFGEPGMEFKMVEAKGCGDLHCRIVAENREKYPMPPQDDPTETFGPIATADQIKFTPEEKCYKEPQHFRPESGGIYRNGYCAEWTAVEQYAQSMSQHLGSKDVIDVLVAMEPDQKKVEHVTRCVFEAAGKMACSEFAAIKGIRDWLGVPGDLNDGRVLGGLIEVVLQAMLVDYSVLAFDEEKVVLEIDQKSLEKNMGADLSLLTTAYVAMWYGMSKTLIGAMWSLWRETDGVPEGTLRIKIARKIDKYC
ncbi:MAG: hypothetical protein JXA42_08885 [Anaerolineales bacterium]|nr:hypothetical protein [Anaerolineales bacterium]